MMIDDRAYHEQDLGMPKSSVDRQVFRASINFGAAVAG